MYIVVVEDIMKSISLMANRPAQNIFLVFIIRSCKMIEKPVSPCVRIFTFALPNLSHRFPLPWLNVVAAPVEHLRQFFHSIILFICKFVFLESASSFVGKNSKISSRVSMWSSRACLVWIVSEYEKLRRFSSILVFFFFLLLL